MHWNKALLSSPPETFPIFMMTSRLAKYVLTSNLVRLISQFIHTHTISPKKEIFVFEENERITPRKSVILHVTHKTYYDTMPAAQ